MLIKAIQGVVEFEHFEQLCKVKTTKEVRLNEEFESIVSLYDQPHQRVFMRSRDSKMSWCLWLGVTLNMYVSSGDSWYPCYRKPLLQVPDNCDGCLESFDLSHALRVSLGWLGNPETINDISVVCHW